MDRTDQRRRERNDRLPQRLAESLWVERLAKLGYATKVKPSFDTELTILLGMLRVGTQSIDSNSEQPVTLRFRLDAPFVSPEPVFDDALGVSFPFTLSATVVGSLADESFNVDLTGAGTGFLPLTCCTIDGRLVFEDAPAVPEPSTLFLTGTCLAVVEARRRRGTCQRRV
jgi:hypothetical protein